MLQPKKAVKKTESTVIKPVLKKDRFKNLGGEKGRPTGPTSGRIKPTQGSAKNGKPVKKAFLGSLLGGAGKSMLGGMGKQMLGGMASQALGGLMGGGNKGGGQAAAQGGQGSEAQAPMQKRKSTDMTPVRTRGMMKKGGKVTKAKNGKSFPDLNKDGKITKADILKGRGVIAKKGTSVKKAQNGYKASKIANDWEKDRSKKYPSVKMTSTKNYDTKETTYPGGDKETTTKFNPRGGAKFNIPSIEQTKGSKGMSENEKVKKGITRLAPLKKKAKTGASIKTCKGGC